MQSGELHWYGAVEDGELIPVRRRDFIEALSGFNGKKVHLLIDTSDRRSDQHNRYYFGCLRWLSLETGYSVEEIHEINKRECNTQIRFVLNRKTGEMQEKVFGGSTKRMKTGDFMAFVERVRQFWAEQGYVIPDEYWVEA